MTETTTTKARNIVTEEQIRAECEYYVRSGEAVDTNDAAEIVADMLGVSWREVFDIACDAPMTHTPETPGEEPKMNELTRAMEALVDGLRRNHEEDTEDMSDLDVLNWWAETVSEAELVHATADPQGEYEWAVGYVGRAFGLVSK